MAVNLDESTIIRYIIGDFESCWDALAALPGPLPRGNFLFARQAMTLLEVACRLCKADPTGNALQDFSNELSKKDQRYFTVFPHNCWKPSKRTAAAFDLPHLGTSPKQELIAAMFNLIRNGQAHQYQQMRADMNDQSSFQFALTGAEHGLYLASVLFRGRPADHLLFNKQASRDLWVTVRTDVLFLDIRNSLYGAHLLDRGLKLQFINERFEFSSAAAEKALVDAGFNQQ